MYKQFGERGLSICRQMFNSSSLEIPTALNSVPLTVACLDFSERSGKIFITLVVS